jgi:hypothetical protein
MIQTDSTILYQFPTLDLECAHYEFLINHLFVLSAQYEVFFENKKIAELFSLAMTPRGRKIIELIFARLGKNPRAKQSKYAIDFLNHQSPEFGGMLSLLIKGDGFSALTQIFNVIRDDESREPEVLAGTIKLLMHMIPKIDNILSLGTLLSSANGIRCLAEILAISSNDNRSIQLILDAIITECISIKGTNHLTYMELMFHTGQGIELFTIICEYCSTIMIQYDELICNIWSEKSGQLLHHACKLSEEDGYNTLFYVFAKYQMKQCIALLASTDAAEINTDWLVSALVAKSSEITSDSSIIKMLSKPGNSWLIKSIKDMLLHVNISKQHKDDLIAAMAERGYGTQRSIRQALEGLATGREVITYIESKSSSTQVSLFTSPIKRISRLVVGPAL